MSQRFFPRDEYFMRLALREAERSLEHEDVPVGCVIAHEGEVIAAAPNERELRGDPTAHCEVLAVREAARALGSWRLSGAAGSVLDVLGEPRLNHRPEVGGGLLADESAALLRGFFGTRR